MKHIAKIAFVALTLVATVTSDTTTSLNGLFMKMIRCP